MRGVLFFGLTGLACITWYQLLAGSPSFSEAYAGVPVAIGSAVLAVLLRSRSRRFAYPQGAAGATMRAIAAILPDSVRVGRELGLAIIQHRTTSRGCIAMQPFQTGDEGGQDAARRALTILGISLSPNGFVIDAPPGNTSPAIAVHQLRQAPPKPDPEWPV